MWVLFRSTWAQSHGRILVWALYALPPELQVVFSSNADLTQLIDIARIANKYSFKSLETWALDAVQEYVNRRPGHTPGTPSTPGISSPSNGSFFAGVGGGDQLNPTQFKNWLACFQPV